MRQIELSWEIKHFVNKLNAPFACLTKEQFKNHEMNENYDANKNEVKNEIVEIIGKGIVSILNGYKYQIQKCINKLFAEEMWDESC